MEKVVSENGTQFRFFAKKDNLNMSHRLLASPVNGKVENERRRLSRSCGMQLMLRPTCIWRAWTIEIHLQIARSTNVRRTSWNTPLLPLLLQHNAMLLDTPSDLRRNKHSCAIVLVRIQEARRLSNQRRISGDFSLPGNPSPSKFHIVVTCSECNI